MMAQKVGLVTNISQDYDGLNSWLHQPNLVTNISYRQHTYQFSFNQSKRQLQLQLFQISSISINPRGSFSFNYFKSVQFQSIQEVASASIISNQFNFNQTEIQNMAIKVRAQALRLAQTKI